MTIPPPFGEGGPGGIRSGGRALTLALALLLGGCAGDGPPPSGSGSAFDQIQTEIFNVHCLNAGCHNAQSQAGALNLTPGASYAALIDVVPDNPAAAADGLLRVEPFDPSNSFLLVKLTAPSAAEGARMPLGMPALSQSDIAMIEAWILDGAPPGGTAPPTASATPLPATPTVTETATVTPTAVDTGTPTPSVTGTPPPTLSFTPTASPSPSPSPSPTLSAFAVIQQTIFNPTCLDMFCHTAEFAAGNLVLVEGQSYAQLVDVLSDNPAARAAGLLRVEPGVPDESFLIIKLTGPTRPQGSRMPLGKPPLPAADIDLIRAWIEAGALP